MAVSHKLLFRLGVTLAALLSIVPPIHGRAWSAKEVAAIFAHAAKHYPKKIIEPEGTLQLKQSFDTKKRTTNYYMQDDQGVYDKKAKPAFVRKKNDQGISWLFIPKAKDRLYNWEKQSIVVLRKVPKRTDIYSALVIHFRLLTGNKIVYEWDVWRPRGYKKKSTCECQLIDKFYRYCTNWTFCDYQYNVYEQAEDDRVEDSRRKRGVNGAKSKSGKAVGDVNVEETSVLNRMPPGTKQALGPFFWDLVDDEFEAGTLYKQIKEEVKNDRVKAIYEDQLDIVPFSGFNDCPYWVKPGDFEEATSSNSPQLLLQFLAKALRSQCILQEEQDITKDLFGEGLLYWDAKKGDIFFNGSHPMTTTVNIDNQDLDNVERALHIAAFSRMYSMVNKAIKKEKINPQYRDAISPLGKKIHRNSRMIVLVSIKLYEMIHTSLKQHAVKLVKRLIANLKDNLMLNVQYHVDVEGANKKKCLKDKACLDRLKTIKKDQTQIVSLIYFFLFGFDPTTIDDVFDDMEGDGFEDWDTLQKYKQFYEFHVKFLEQTTNYYFEEPKDDNA